VIHKVVGVSNEKDRVAEEKYPSLQ
jgi:hypothetical protein